MKLKLTLALVVFTPIIVMAQAPVIAPPEVVKEPFITRPSEGGSGVYKPAAPVSVNPPAKPAKAPEQRSVPQVGKQQSVRNPQKLNRDPQYNPNLHNQDSDPPWEQLNPDGPEGHFGYEIHPFR